MKCDGCGVEVLHEELMYVRVPRPSDSSDMCCVLWGCCSCFPRSYGSVMNDQEWSEWIENDGLRQGYMWLT